MIKYKLSVLLISAHLMISLVTMLSVPAEDLLILVFVGPSRLGSTVGSGPVELGNDGHQVAEAPPCLELPTTHSRSSLSSAE